MNQFPVEFFTIFVVQRCRATSSVDVCTLQVYFSAFREWTRSATQGLAWVLQRFQSFCVLPCCTKWKKKYAKNANISGDGLAWQSSETMGLLAPPPLSGAVSKQLRRGATGLRLIPESLLDNRILCFSLNKANRKKTSYIYKEMVTNWMYRFCPSNNNKSSLQLFVLLIKSNHT